MSLIEAVIYNFSGLSTDEKPLTAAGNPMPNGSRFREVDTGKTYHFNTSDKRWYETLRNAQFIAGAAPIVDIRALEVLEQMAVSLKKIEYHLMLASDADLKEEI